MLSILLGILLVIPFPILAQEITPTTIINPSSGVELSEFMPYVNPEWVEISNSTSDHLTLTNWSIGDSTTNTKQIPDTTIPPHGIVSIEIGSNFLNNDGDLIRLINNNGNEVERFVYGNTNSSERAKSWSKSSGVWCQTSPTREIQNESCVLPSNTPTTTQTPTVTPVPTETPNQQNTASYPSVTPTQTLSPTQTITKTPTPTKTLTPTKTIIPTPLVELNLYQESTEPEINTENWQEPELFSESILGESTVDLSTGLPTPSVIVLGVQKESNDNKLSRVIPVILIILGVLLISLPVLIKQISNVKNK